MRVFSRLSFVPAVVFCALCFGLFAHAWIVAAVMAAAVIPAVFARRFSLDTPGQLIVGLLAGAGAYLLVFVIFDPPQQQRLGELHILGKMGALWCIGMAGFRLFVRNPLGKEIGTAMLLISAWLFLGLGRLGMGYMVLMPMGFGLVLLAVKFEQQHRNETWKSARQLVSGTLLLGIALLVSGFFVFFIPRAYAFAVSRYVDSLTAREMGFSTILELGTVREMLVSKKVTMRVFTPPGQIRHLRGAVYNTYRQRYWSNSTPLQHEPIGPTSRSVTATGSPQQRMEIRPVSDLERYFVPLGTASIASPQPSRIDQLGVVTPADGKPVERYSVLLSDTANILPPTGEDLSVPEYMVPRLSELIRQWGIAKEVPLANHEKVQRLVRQLEKNYAYSLTFERSDKEDALMDFLFRNKKGHCEYFASAFALLARSVGVPTRVVGGYYLSEYNPMGGYYIVREQHAHTWTECWVDGGWVTVDATPAGGIAAASSTVNLWLDSVWVKTSEIVESILRLNKYIFLWIVLGLLVVWAGVRFLQRKKQKIPPAPQLNYHNPHQIFLALQQLLEQTLPRKGNETIEHWADRLDQDAPHMAVAKQLLLDYAAWRYGGQGTIDEINQRYLTWKTSL